jgi:hypothetical protein
VRLICKKMVTGQNSTGQVTELQDNFLYCTLFDDHCTRQTILYCTLFDMLNIGQNNIKFTIMSFLMCNDWFCTLIRNKILKMWKYFLLLKKLHHRWTMSSTLDHTKQVPSCVIFAITWMNQQNYSDSDVNKYCTKYGSERERVKYVYLIEW